MYPGFHAASRPGRPAVVMAGSGETVTYRELEERSVRLARLLHGRGLRPGDHIALIAENHLRYFEVLWAALRSGLYLTAVNRHLAPAEAAYLVNDSGAAALITTAGLAAYAHEVTGHVEGCGIRLMMDGPAEGFDSYEKAISGLPAEPMADQPRGEVMLYSSGTTGRPKGIKRPRSRLQIDEPGAVGPSRLQSALLGMDEESVYLCPAPLYHAAALQWSAGAHELGATVVIMERFDAEGVLAAIDRYRVTHAQVVPTMIVRMLKLPEDVRAGHDLSSLRLLLHAAAPCPVDIKRQAIDWLGPIVSEYYSGTEGNGFTFITTEEWLAHPGSVGRAILGTPHICAEDGAELPPHEVGLVYFDPQTPPFEYHRDAAKTETSRHPVHRSWSTLGDLGYLDGDGYLYLTDRRAFTIISGGVNIYPVEIESCLINHPRVVDVAVLGLPDPDFGERVHAVVQPVGEVTGDDDLADELRDLVRTGLGGFKVPKTIDFVPELPRTAAGKLNKHSLRAALLGEAP